HVRAGRGAAVHLSACVPVQRAPRCAGGEAARAAAGRGGARAGARAAGAGRRETTRLSRRPRGADGGWRAERSRRGEGRAADSGLPFRLSSYRRMERTLPLRGDGSVAMPRIYIETYGCQMNVSDSELMLGVLGRDGYVRTDDPALADVLLVNTCAVRDHAEQKVLSRLGELKVYKRRDTVLGVVGCMAQRLGPRLLGQTVNSYTDGEHDFADLVRAVGAVAGLRRLRFTSPYPTDFTERVLTALAETPPVCEHVYLPVQSGSSRVLKRMLRRYDRA